MGFIVGLVVDLGSAVVMICERRRVILGDERGSS
jgi:hypothetical protein